jgi:hypothetical protein
MSKTTIDMACESKLIYRTNGRWWMDAGEPGDELKRFEALVRADEREACAALADKLEWADNKGVASAIRARGNT